MLNGSLGVKSGFLQQLCKCFYRNRWLLGAFLKKNKKVLVTLLEEGSEVEGWDEEMCLCAAPCFCLLSLPPSPGSPDTDVSLHLVPYKGSLYRPGVGSHSVLFLTSELKASGAPSRSLLLSVQSRS